MLPSVAQCVCDTDMAIKKKKVRGEYLTESARGRLEEGRNTVTRSVSFDTEIWDVMEEEREGKLVSGRPRERSRELTAALEVYYALQGRLPKGRQVIDPVLVAKVSGLTKQ